MAREVLKPNPTWDREWIETGFQSILEKPSLNQLGLPWALYMRLRRAGFSTIEGLQRGLKERQPIRQIGPKSIRIINEALGRHNPNE